MAEKIYQGIGVSDGIRSGIAFVYRREPEPDTNRTVSKEQTEAEVKRLDRAVEQAGQEIDRLIARASETLGSGDAAVIKGQKTFLADPAYCPEMKKLILGRQYSAEKAVREVTDRYAAVFEGMSNRYMQERATDVRDAGTRLLNYLSGVQSSGLSKIDHPVILIADDLSPSDTVQLNREMILAFATRQGGKTSHTSVFARSLGIPAVVGVPEIMEEVADGETLILDGNRGVCVASPEPETRKVYLAKMEEEHRKAELFGRFASRNAQTKDGARIIAAANIGSAADAEDSLKKGAEAVGLFRTEQVYLSTKSLPDENAQFEVYRKVAECFGSKEVIVRTLDVGGDKEIKYLGIEKETNPFLGYRAIRYCLDRKEIFLTQLRAILRASAFGRLAVMFPMISGMQELAAAKTMVEEAKEQLRGKGEPFDESIRIGMMVEIPSAALMASALAKEADFFSVGTNDLVQYTLAVDRGNEKVSYLYDYFDPAVIRLIRLTADAASSAGIPMGMCGAMAGDPLAVPLLVGLGLSELSMAAGSLAQTKYILSRLDTGSCRELAEKADRCRNATEVRSLLQEYFETEIKEI
ncbi:phosphoenolpyruvate--protein phosphotransferase [Caproicibacter fermentans]|uniref:Phosphoenolpyruvate-protein phosphotransferase n=1 Tax=Caproicibacter fermentans TaxID=2576756 RepID=A0A7G8TEN5_9FIRM|nr:phosphoenolpyruvate--protein phosphotransferase [Caproicibacter fermentans]QNK42076.1 phosphoenolpyruvate--protein phosphotransferase [Caproicibacter fermentans]